MDDHQIRIIQVAQNPGSNDTFLFNKLGATIKIFLPDTKILAWFKLSEMSFTNLFLDMSC